MLLISKKQSVIATVWVQDLLLCLKSLQSVTVPIWASQMDLNSTSNQTYYLKWIFSHVTIWIYGHHKITYLRAPGLKWLVGSCPGYKTGPTFFLLSARALIPLPLVTPCTYVHLTYVTFNNQPPRAGLPVPWAPILWTTSQHANRNAMPLHFNEEYLHFRIKYEGWT